MSTSVSTGIGATVWQSAVVRAEVASENGRRFTLCEREGPDENTRYVAGLATEFGTVRTTVWEYRSSLATFVSGLADDWQGFDGTREYLSTEGQLALRCTHDGLGAVECEVTLRQPWPPTWSTSAVLTLGAGAHLATFAADVEAFFAFAE